MPDGRLAGRRRCAAAVRAAPHHSCRTPQLAEVEQALLDGVAANGFVGELWTLDRIGLVIERLTGVRHHPAHLWALLRHRLGWTVQRPIRQAAERDQDTINRWVKQTWPLPGRREGGAAVGRLPAHRSSAMRDWLHTQRSWLVTERLPAYAPDLNPVEGLWSSLKAVELANLSPPTLAEVIDQAHRGIDRVRRTPHLAYSFLRHTGLLVA